MTFGFTQTTARITTILSGRLSFVAKNQVTLDLPQFTVLMEKIYPLLFLFSVRESVFYSINSAIFLQNYFWARELYHVWDTLKFHHMPFASTNFTWTVLLTISWVNLRRYSEEWKKVVCCLFICIVLSCKRKLKDSFADLLR
jgi:hypothetical protein